MEAKREDGKFILEFDKEPAFVYVAEGETNKEHIWMNGNKAKHWVGLKLQTDMDGLPEYELKGTIAPYPYKFSDSPKVD